MGALAALWFHAERCVLFYHPQALTVVKCDSAAKT